MKTPGLFMRFSQSFKQQVSALMKGSVVPCLLMTLPALFATGTAGAAPRTLLATHDDFDTRSMTGSTGTSGSAMSRGFGSPAQAGSSTTSLSLGEPGRFYMNQSYSLSAMAGPQGSASSGLYLNTLNYRFTPLMTAFVDVGFQTPIHSSMPGLEQSGNGLGSVVLPRMGLEYRPSDRLTFNFELVNGPDAWKTWGGSPSGYSTSRPTPGSRTP
jgi:hypothetical protein